MIFWLGLVERLPEMVTHGWGWPDLFPLAIGGGLRPPQWLDLSSLFFSPEKLSEVGGGGRCLFVGGGRWVAASEQ
jgi:hypothetical protein